MVDKYDGVLLRTALKETAWCASFLSSSRVSLTLSSRSHRRSTGFLLLYIAGCRLEDSKMIQAGAERTIKSSTSAADFASLEVLERCRLVSDSSPSHEQTVDGTMPRSSTTFAWSISSANCSLPSTHLCTGTQRGPTLHLPHAVRVKTQLEGFRLVCFITSIGLMPAVELLPASSLLQTRRHSFVRI